MPFKCFRYLLFFFFSSLSTLVGADSRKKADAPSIAKVPSLFTASPPKKKLRKYRKNRLKKRKKKRKKRTQKKPLKKYSLKQKDIFQIVIYVSIAIIGIELVLLAWLSRSKKAPPIASYPKKLTEDILKKYLNDEGYKIRQTENTPYALFTAIAQQLSKREKTNFGDGEKIRDIPPKQIVWKSY